MAEETRTTRRDNTDLEENSAQRQSDAPPDVVAQAQREVVEASDREDGRGSTANGTPASDDADGALRRKLYKEGAEIVSRID